MGEDNNEVWINEDERNGKKKKYIVVLAIIVLIVCGIVFSIFSINKKINGYTNKIYPGVTINGVAVGGKTIEEAKTLIEVNLLEQVKDKTIKLVAKDKSIVLEYAKINPEYRTDEALDKALAMGKKEGMFKQNSYIKEGIKEEIKVEFGYNEKVLDDYLKTLNRDVTIPAKNASLEVVGDNINIISAINGIELDIAKAKAILDENIDCDLNIMNDTIEVPVREQLPKVTDEIISEVDSKFGSASTSFNTGDWSRVENLKVATRNISGTVLMPGETFSYNDVVGERTVERGFKSGASFSGNEVVQTIGGGICQISTTLYQAVMRSGIKSVERSNHSMKVGYAAPSEDATVAWGYLDYKFKNTYDSPIFIQGIITDGIVTFNIFGNKDDIGNKTYDLVGVTTGSNGSSLSSIGYLITYENGKEVSKEEVSRDFYN